MQDKYAKNLALALQETCLDFRGQLEIISIVPLIHSIIFYFYCYTVHVVELLNYNTNHCTYIKFIYVQWLV